MTNPDETDTARLLRMVERVEQLMEERRAIERDIQGLVADALDAGLCVRSFEMGLALAYRVPGPSERMRPLRLSDFIRGGFLVPDG